MRSRDTAGLVSAIIVVALVMFMGAALLLDVDTLIGGEFSVWERVGVLGLALLVLAPFAVYRARSRRGGFLATLLGTALWVPWIAALASSALYLANIEGSTYWHDNALLIGTSIAGAIWMLHALVDADYATAKRQSPGWYGLLQGQIRDLRAEVDGLIEPRLGATGEAVRRRVRGQLDHVDHDLRQTGVQWVTRSGFNAAWTHYHLADETWIEARPLSSVTALAITDILRLESSDISHRPDLEVDLWRAVTDLDPKLDRYVQALLSADVVVRVKSEIVTPSAATPAAAVTTATTTPQAQKAGNRVKRIATKCALFAQRVTRAACRGQAPRSRVATAPGAGEASPSIEQGGRARAVIQSVHNAVNGYRGSRWAELARARWQLVQTTTIAGTFSLLVLGLALIRDVSATQLVAGWAYFLVGAVAGLFLRLRQAADEEHVADDYGLESARLNQTPLLSGMAAVIGVVLMASLAGSTLGDVLRPTGAASGAATAVSATVDGSPSASAAESMSPPASAPPTPSATASPAEATPTTADLATAFDLGTYPAGLIIALIFGLTPSLVLQRVGVAATRAKEELAATRAAT